MASFNNFSLQKQQKLEGWSSTSSTSQPGVPLHLPYEWSNAGTCQVVTMQVHTGSQKLVGIHQTCDLDLQDIFM